MKRVPVASARNSLLREMASCKSVAARGVTMIRRSNWRGFVLFPSLSRPPKPPKIAAHCAMCAM